MLYECGACYCSTIHQCTQQTNTTVRYLKYTGTWPQHTAMIFIKIKNLDLNKWCCCCAEGGGGLCCAAHSHCLFIEGIKAKRNGALYWGRVSKVTI